MRIIDLVQGSQEWLEWRRGGIGGSDIPAILGISPYKDATPESVRLSKRGQEPALNFQMMRGTRLEPKVRNLIGYRHGRIYEPICIEHEEHPWARASLDGLDPAKISMIEIKCPNYLIHDQILCGFVPEYFLVQCQWQMFVAGMVSCTFVSFNDGKRFSESKHLAEIEVQSSPRPQQEIFEAAEKFWRDYTSGR